MTFARRELQAQEALQNGQLCSGDGVPDLQPGALASQAVIEKILGEDPRWQGNPEAAAVGGRAGGPVPSVCKVTTRWTSPPSFVDQMGKLSLQSSTSPPVPQVEVAEWDLNPGVQAGHSPWRLLAEVSQRPPPGEAGAAPSGAPVPEPGDVHRTPALRGSGGLQPSPRSSRLHPSGPQDARSWQAPRVMAVGGKVLGGFIVNTRNVNLLFQLIQSQHLVSFGTLSVVPPSALIPEHSRHTHGTPSPFSSTPPPRHPPVGLLSVCSSLPGGRRGGAVLKAPRGSP